MFSASKTSGPSGYNLTNSLRFRSSASAYLNRTPASAGNRQTWTASFWIKKGALGTSPRFFSTSDLGSNDFAIDFSGDSLELWGYVSAAVQLQLITTAVYRDPSAWYHIVVVIDTTQATSSNRAKIYVNGSQVTAFSTATYPAQNTSFLWNSTAAARIGIYQTGSSAFDGYMAEMYFIDGQALTPSSFGSTNATTGVWQPAKYTGTYGTNGFYLNFSNIALTSGSNTGLGKDNSGNGNYWNTNNISVTAGTTYDAMTDVPTLTSATVANYATLNPLLKSNTSLSSANLQVTTSGGAGSNQWTLSPATNAPSSGKWYVEFYIVSKTADAGGSSIGIGLQSTNALSTYTSGNYLGQQTTGEYNYQAHGYTFFNNVQSGTAVWASYTTGDTIGVAFDLDSYICYWYKNNTLQGSTSLISGYSYAPAISVYQASIASFNAGQRPFTYTPPTGYVALNTYNLPTPTILQGNKYMDATLYTGNSSTQTITNAGAFKPDLVWLKCRSTAGTWNNLVDSVRGTSKTLYSNTTNAEGTDNYLSAFNSNGFGLNVGDSGTNTSGNTYVGWQWQAGQGSTSSNTSGSITSTVSVNTTAGFSVVTYTGNNTLSTVGHGLGVGPKFIIVKTRSGTDNWVVYHASLGVQYYSLLNTTAASYNNLSNYWSSTAPSSTTFGINAYGGVNTNAATYVAYCWAEIAGFSKFTSYTGNGSTDGTFVYLGFRPKFIMTKRTDSSTNGFWNVYDSARNGYNDNNDVLYPNSSSAEDDVVQIDILSNGFKCRNTLYPNTSGGTYIVAAWAENPFKNSLAR